MGWSNIDPETLVTYAQGGPVHPHTETLLTAEHVGPNTFERVVKVVLQMAGVIALLLASIWMILTLTAVASIAHRVGQVDDTTDPGPVPSVTGCPFGPDDCGGVIR